VKKSFFIPPLSWFGSQVAVSAGSIGGRKTLAEDPTSSPQRGAGCFFPPDLWKENCLMMRSESLSGSRTREAREMLLQVLQFETSKIFSQLQGGTRDFGGESPTETIPLR
jgi:hypothetical protein